MENISSDKDEKSISREKFWRYDSPWSYNYSRSLPAISEWLRACRCAKSQFSPKRPKKLVWPKRLKMDQEGQKMNQEGVKIVFFDPKHFFWFGTFISFWILSWSLLDCSEPGSTATVLPVIVQPGESHTYPDMYKITSQNHRFRQFLGGSIPLSVRHKHNSCLLFASTSMSEGNKSPKFIENIWLHLWWVFVIENISDMTRLGQFTDIGRKVVAVGRNYADHAKELGNAVSSLGLTTTQILTLWASLDLD